VDAMLNEMSMSEYIHWQAIYSVEPFPEDRADRRTAEIIQALMLGRTKQLPSISDLLPDWWSERQPQQQTPEQMRANLDLIKSATRKKKHAS
jgi:hypothetical protein